MDRLAFKPVHRLLSKRDFDRVFARASRSGSRYFTVLGASNDIKHARLGLAISKRVDGRAVARNRLKRLIRESFRHSLPSLPGVDLVVIARPGASRAESDELRDALERHWKKMTEIHSTDSRAPAR